MVTTTVYPTEFYSIVKRLYRSEACCLRRDIASWEGCLSIRATGRAVISTYSLTYRTEQVGNVLASRFG